MTTRSECSTIQWIRFANWQVPPPTPGRATPFDSRIPSTKPRRAVQLPTTLLKDRDSPGRIRIPLVRGQASRKFTTLLRCSHISDSPS